jgi:hypothetical protein
VSRPGSQMPTAAEVAAITVVVDRDPDPAVLLDD